MSQATEEKLEMYEEWREAKQEERAEAEGEASQKASQTDTWDVGEVIDPPEATIQVGPHKLVFRELTYKQAKGLFGITNRIINKAIKDPQFNAFASDDTHSTISANIGVIVDAALAEVVDFICHVFNIKDRASFEENLKISQILEIVNIIFEQNQYEVQLITEQLKKTREQAKRLGILPESIDKILTIGETQ